MWLKKLFGASAGPKREEFSFEHLAMLPLHNLLKEESSPFDEWRADDAHTAYFIQPELENLVKFWVWSAQFDVFYCLIGERFGADAVEEAREVHASMFARAPDAEWIKANLDFGWNAASCCRKVIAGKTDQGTKFNAMLAQFILTTHPASPFYREVDTDEPESESFLTALNALQVCITHGRAKAADYFSKTLDAVKVTAPKARSADEKHPEFSFDTFVMLPLLRMLEEQAPFSRWRAEDPQDPYVMPRGIGSFFKFWVWATQLEVFYLLIERRFGAELALKARQIHKAKLEGMPDAKRLNEVLLLSEVAEGVRKEIAEQGDARIEFAHMFSRINLTSHPVSPFNGSAHNDLQSDDDYIVALSALQKCVTHGRAAAFDYFENAFNLASVKLA